LCSALPAAFVAAFGEAGERKVLLAAEAAFLLVTPVDPVCASALPAADFAALLALGDRSVLPAAEAAFFPVDSLFAIRSPEAPASLAFDRKAKRPKIHATATGCATWASPERRELAKSPGGGE
jgi:hypothetical protein